MGFTKLTKSSSGLKALVYGRPGTGKTTLLGTAPGPIFVLDTDGGMASLGEADVMVSRPLNYEDFKADVDILLSGETKVGTLCVDTVSELCQMAVMHYAVKAGRDLPVLKDYGDASEDVFRLMDKILKFSAWGTNVILIAHDKQDKDDRTGAISTEPLMFGKLPRRIAGKCDAVLYADVRVSEGAPAYQLLTMPEDGINAKVRSEVPVLERWERPDIQYIINRLGMKINRDKVEKLRIMLVDAGVKTTAGQNNKLAKYADNLPELEKKLKAKLKEIKK